MSKLNPQNATAYVGPGVLRKGGKITPVPNGPLIKKTGKFKGSTLKNGGPVKKETKTVVRDKTAVKKPDVKNIMKRDNDMAVRKNKNEAAYHAYNRGLDVKSVMQGNPSNETVEMMMNAARRDDSLSNVALKKAREAKSNPMFKSEKTPKLNVKIKAKAGAMIKRADGSMSKRGLWDNIRKNKGSGKKPTKQMLLQEKKIKAKSKK